MAHVLGHVVHFRHGGSQAHCIDSGRLRVMVQ
jgi:hypothetical protein